MTLEQIKQAIKDGKRVFSGTSIYEVIKDDKDQYLITCHLNSGTCIGLYWTDYTVEPNEVHLNGSDFYIEDNDNHDD